MALTDNSEPKPANSTETEDLHRAIASLMEELDAIDRYAQRAELCADVDLREVLIHNKREEIEHAMMLVEWLRRKEPVFDTNAQKLLFTSGSIARVEQLSKLLNGPAAADGSLGIGSLKGAPWTS